MSDSESKVQAIEQLRAARRGAWLLRNNSGAMKDETGRQVRFGLGNISKKFNDVCKSPDLCGIEPVVITADMVGQTIGRALLRECKPEGWVYTGTAREVAQKKFLDKARSLGADAYFTNGSCETTGESGIVPTITRSNTL
jgi:hypothetical protein